MRRKLLIILQARCSSRRLPGKVLKKINQLPLVVLCFKRLSNKGRRVIVATSNHKSDDKLVNLLKKFKIPYYRGSLNNVLSRYQKISRDLKPNDIIVRATSDNPIPDGSLVEMVYKHFLIAKKDYLQIEHKLHNLPKGVRIEILTVKKLLSLKRKLSLLDKEHVTYKIYKNKKNFYRYFFKSLYSRINLSEVVMSIDTIEHFRYVKKIFKKHSNLIKVSYKKILKTCIKDQLKKQIYE